MSKMHLKTTVDRKCVNFVKLCKTFNYDNNLCFELGTIKYFTRSSFLSTKKIYCRINITVYISLFNINFVRLLKFNLN